MGEAWEGFKTFLFIHLSIWMFAGFITLLAWMNRVTINNLPEMAWWVPGLIAVLSLYAMWAGVVFVPA